MEEVAKMPCERINLPCEHVVASALLVFRASVDETDEILGDCALETA
jgi:hypothetical protein